MKRLFLACLIGAGACAAFAQDRVAYSYKTAAGTSETLEAVVTRPATPGKRPAVVILHHSGGWEFGTTRQYADLLSKNGYLTIEPILFPRRNQATYADNLRKAMGVVAYLGSREDVDIQNVSVMGLSYGAHLTVLAMTEWARTQGLPASFRWRKAVAFYPSCWIFSAFIKREMDSWLFKDRWRDIPPDAMDAWVAAPLKILAGGLDDYEGKEPRACPDLQAMIPSDAQRSMTQVVVYPDATHGWDHGRTYSFHEPAACRGRGCTNTNAFNAQVTDKAKQELLSFLRQD